MPRGLGLALASLVLPATAAAAAAAARGHTPPAAAVFPGSGCGVTTSYKVVDTVPDNVSSQDLSCTIVEDKVND